MSNLADLAASTVRIPMRFQHVDGEDVVTGEFYYRVMNDNRYPHVQNKQIRSSLDRDGLLKLMGGVILRSFFGNDQQEYYLISNDNGSLTCLDVYMRSKSQFNYTFCIAGTKDRVNDYLHKCEAIPLYVDPVRKEKPKAVDLTYWFKTKDGAAAQHRRLMAQTWDEVGANYHASTRRQFASLVSLTEPPQSGRLILAWGKPGTGKTNSLLTLAKSWDWANVNYIMDANDFFADPAYMMQVALQGINLDDYEDEPDEEECDDEGNIIEQDSSDDKPKTANVIIIEDADELISADAKNRVGQALSKLLNLTDGLVGRGLNTYVFITTNEPIDNLHEAITRPGRCLANIEFKNLTHEEAESWATSHNVTLPRQSDEWSLAELFSLVNTSLVSRE